MTVTRLVHNIDRLKRHHAVEKTVHRTLQTVHILLDADGRKCLFMSGNDHYFVIVSCPTILDSTCTIQASKVLDFGTGASEINKDNEDKWYLIEVYINKDPGYDIITDSLCLMIKILEVGYNDVSVVWYNRIGDDKMTETRPQINAVPMDTKTFPEFIDQSSMVFHEGVLNEHHEICVDHQLYKLTTGHRVTGADLVVFTRPIMKSAGLCTDMFNAEDIYDYVMNVGSTEGIIETLAYRYARGEIDVTEDYDVVDLVNYLGDNAMSDVRDLVHHLLYNMSPGMSSYHRSLKTDRLQDWSDDNMSPYECEDAPIQRPPVSLLTTTDGTHMMRLVIPDIISDEEMKASGRGKMKKYVSSIIKDYEVDKDDSEYIDECMDNYVDEDDHYMSDISDEEMTVDMSSLQTVDITEDQMIIGVIRKFIDDVMH